MLKNVTYGRENAEGGYADILQTELPPKKIRRKHMSGAHQTENRPVERWKNSGLCRTVVLSERVDRAEREGERSRASDDADELDRNPMLPVCFYNGYVACQSRAGLNTDRRWCSRWAGRRGS